MCTEKKVFYICLCYNQAKFDAWKVTPAGVQWSHVYDTVKDRKEEEADDDDHANSDGGGVDGEDSRKKGKTEEKKTEDKVYVIVRDDPSHTFENDDYFTMQGMGFSPFLLWLWCFEILFYSLPSLFF